MAEDLKRTVESVDTRLEKAVAPLEAGVTDLNDKLAAVTAAVEKLTADHEKTAGELAEAGQFLVVLAELAGMSVPAEAKSAKK